MSPVDVYLEVSDKRVFAAAYDWPGWCRSGKTEDAALETLADYASRYAPVAKAAGITFDPGPGKDLRVLERVPGDATTAFGAPSVVTSRDLEEPSKKEKDRILALLAASWEIFDRVVAASPEELRKGPRGGGRDRSKIVAHVLGAESGYSRLLGLKLGEPDPSRSDAVESHRQALLDGLRAADATRRLDEGKRRWPMGDRGPQDVTYSIVARDPSTGQLGVAVQSKYFSVGSVVTWAEPGVGAVATQSFAEPSYGPKGLNLMRQGRGAAEALAALVAEDELRDRRQVGMVDALGGAASHTGRGCIVAAGHALGEGYACQANLMLNDTVWGAMAEAYDSAAGDLPERLLAALDAAEAQGGDLRGRQSVAILVVSADVSLPAWKKELDLRVEDHADPLVEIRRLLRLRRAFDRVEEVEEGLLNGDDATAALADLEAFADLGDANIDFTRAIALAMAGKADEARTLVSRLAAADPGWAVAARRYADAGILADDPGVIAALTPAG